MKSMWYRQEPDRLDETDDILVRWDMTIPCTASKIKENRPSIYICLINKKTDVCLLIDISCPADMKVSMKHDEE